MNEQQLQQILTIQQAIAAAATAAVINSLLNPQQAAAGGLNPLQALQSEHQSANDGIHQQHQDAAANSRLSPSSGSPVQTPANSAPPAPDNNNNRLQELLLQLQLASSSPAAASLNLNQQQHAALAAAVAASAANQQLQATQNHCRSPPLLGAASTGGGGLAPNRQPQSAAGFLNSSTATSSNSSPHHSSSILNSSSSQTSSPNKKLKTRHPHQHQPPTFQHNVRSSEATSKLQHQHHSMPKNHSATLSSHHHHHHQHHQTSKNINSNNNNSSSSTSSSFLTNNVGLPRKLVRGQDVWLGRGAEQTRQILKCIVCGLSFRTLAEMVQHMKDTQHYTNIVSQEQITSWRQPDNPADHFHKGSNKTSNNKNPQAQVHSLNDAHDEQMSEKLNDSDRDDSYGNDDDSTIHQNKSSSQRLFSHQSRVQESHIKSESIENINLTDPSVEHSRKTNSKTSSHQHPRPLTRSKRREHDTSSPTMINKSDDGTIESSSSRSESASPSQPQVQRQNSNSSINLLLKDLNEKIESDNDVVADRKLIDRKRSESPTGASKSDEELTDDEGKQQENEEGENEADENEAQDDRKDARKRVEGIQSEEIQSVIGKERLKKLIDDGEADESDYDENHPDAHTDDNADEQNSETNESILAALKSGQPGQKTATGDPLSALETMVEKSFDPRMRPGVANGGILQRLGIDEEVCPPWQHINYANWYAAATYGHPMAAALLAAGLNMQTNGIKLSKNMSSKKSDD